MSKGIVHRFRRWVIGAIAFGAVLYLAGSIWAGLDEVRGALASFQWAWAFPVLGLTLVNYSLRFFKWHYLIRRLGVPMPLEDDAWNFGSGLAMVISPGKAGELLKPYVVRERTGVPMATTIPALVAERLTDGIAMLILAGFGVTTFAADKVHYLTIPAAIVAIGLGVMASKKLSMTLLLLGRRVPYVQRIVPKLEVMYRAARTCLAPTSMAVTLTLSLLAWGAECVGYLLVFKGIGVTVDLDVVVFIYAFATVAGGAMPGGLGIADAALVTGAVKLIPGMSNEVAVAASLLVRVATLWFGVGIGAAALFRLSAMLGGDIDLEAPAAGEPT